MKKALSDLLTSAVDYRNHLLGMNNASYDTSVARSTQRMQKNLDFRMETHLFRGQDPVAVLEFLASFYTARDHSSV